MASMVERVARALCAADDLDWDLQSDPQTSGSGEDNREAYLHAARAALEAMAEPTEGMVEAEVALHGYSGDRTANGYRAMIQAALTPPR